MLQWRAGMKGSSRDLKLNTFNYFALYTFFNPACLFAAWRRHPTFIWHHLRNPAKLKKKKQFYQNLHTNWSDIKGLTDTSALSGALEIKTSGSELWRSLLFPMCARHPSRWAARAVYHSLCHISHIPATRVKNLGAYRATWPRSEIRADEDGRWKARRGEEEKRLGAQHVAGWKMKKWVAQQREPRGSYGSGKADQWLSPRGRLHRIHTMRDRNMAAAHFFSPNYQTPYWLSSGREEVILFLSPFGKLIHFTKVTW